LRKGECYTIKANTIIIFLALCGQLQRDELSKENGKIIRLWNNQKMVSILLSKHGREIKIIIQANKPSAMGLCIELHFENETTIDVNMCYSSFIKWNFTDHSGCYKGKALKFLIQQLVKSGYLEKTPKLRPVKSIFC